MGFETATLDKRLHSPATNAQTCGNFARCEDTIIFVHCNTS